MPSYLLPSLELLLSKHILEEALITVVHNFIKSRIEYDSTWLYGIYDYNSYHLHQFENGANGIVIIRQLTNVQTNIL